MLMTCTSSGLQTGSVAIYARPARVHGVTLLQAAAACTLIIYDNATAAAGTVIEQINNNTNTSTVSVKFNVPVECDKGIFAALTGTGANYIVHFSPM